MHPFPVLLWHHDQVLACSRETTSTKALVYFPAFPTVLTLTMKLRVMLFHAMYNCVFPYVVSCPIGNEN